VSEVSKLDEAQLDALRAKYGKVGIVDYNEHQIVFKRPTRDNCREYRRMRESPAEKGDAVEFLAQVSIAAFDGETDANKARSTYTNSFLEQYPLFANHPRAIAVMSALTGMMEEEDALDLGKGASVRTGRRASTPEA
jgi:hypothetical protein